MPPDVILVNSALHVLKSVTGFLRIILNNPWPAPLKGITIFIGSSGKVVSIAKITSSIDGRLNGLNWNRRLSRTL